MKGTASGSVEVRRGKRKESAERSEDGPPEDEWSLRESREDNDEGRDEEYLWSIKGSWSGRDDQEQG